MWCIPKLDDEYIERMEDVLDTIAKAPNAAEPVVALDERPVQLLGSKRTGRPSAPGKIGRQDYEYTRNGVANVFGIIAPHEGRHLTHATRDRKAPNFARALKRISDAYPTAERIHLIVDNLNTHREKSLIVTFGEEAGRALWARFAVHYTPKHGSWLNPAEIEISLWSRECLGNRRLASFDDLRATTARWNACSNRARRMIAWRFKKRDARRLFRYRRQSTTSRSQH